MEQQEITEFQRELNEVLAKHQKGKYMCFVSYGEVEQKTQKMIGQTFTISNLVQTDPHILIVMLMNTHQDAFKRFVENLNSISIEPLKMEKVDKGGYR